MGPAFVFTAKRDRDRKTSQHLCSERGINILPRDAVRESTDKKVRTAVIYVDKPQDKRVVNFAMPPPRLLPQRRRCACGTTGSERLPSWART